MGSSDVSPANGMRFSIQAYNQSGQIGYA